MVRAATLILIFALGGCADTGAEDAAERDRLLESRINELSSRVNDIEKRVDEDQIARDPTLTLPPSKGNGMR